MMSCDTRIGNGDIAAEVYAIENGDLYLLLTKNDTLSFCAISTKPADCGFRSFPMICVTRKDCLMKTAFDLMVIAVLCAGFGTELRAQPQTGADERVAELFAAPRAASSAGDRPSTGNTRW